MRILVLYLLLVFVSCKTATGKEKLLGSWTTEQDKSKYPKNGISDRLTFFANDSFKVEMYLNQKMSESFLGKYAFDEKKKRITTKVGKVETLSEITELTDERLTLRHSKSKMISNYKRL